MHQSFRAAARAASFAIAMLFVANQSALAHGFEIGELEIDHPWSRETPEGARVAAGYVKIVNNGSEADRLVAVTGDIAGRTEIHEMAVDDKGVMTMRPIEGVEIPAGGEVELKPGGYHVMFLELTGRPKQGEKFAGTMTFEKAGTVEVEFAVEAMGGAQSHGGGGGHDHGDHSSH